MPSRTKSRALAGKSLEKRLIGVGFSPKSFAKSFFAKFFTNEGRLGKSCFSLSFTEPIMMTRPGKVMMAPARGQSPLPVASPEKRFFFVSRSGEMFSYSANRIRTTKSKTQSWITKKMSRIANVIFIVPQMHNHDCHILLIASRGALRYVQR